MRQDRARPPPLAAARLNIPTLLVIGGYQGSARTTTIYVDIEEVFLGAGPHVAGKLSFDDLMGMCEDAITSPGVCSGMGTANSMHIVCERFMSLPGGAPGVPIRRARGRLREEIRPASSVEMVAGKISSPRSRS